ncbi:MAG: Response regulator receiver domain protein (CheY-like) [uncultured Sulfurovum sp.]|uniref:Response regulator receiver domain protein (CheY-like) n=1 Tax=uncultured Sulfurovum sp. TaxID=269237 RepID=A0A6S6TBL3_9BACT|nr:MAG: Response regulator receiver domain protein (CheY-like) [uncultured Sulfurovum sp.]
MEWDKLGDIKLLIVDDDAFNRQLVISLLSQIGTISFIEAEDGLEALSILKQTEVDMVLLDLHMPNLNGYDTLLEIKKESKYNSIPVAILTTDKQEKVKLYALGADDFLSKPYKLDELESRIYMHIENKQQLKLKQVLVEQEEVMVPNTVPNNVEVNRSQNTYNMEYLEQSQKEIFYNILKFTYQDEAHEKSVKVIASLTKSLAKLIGYGDRTANNISSASVVRSIGLLSFSDKKPILEYQYSSKNKILYEKYIFLTYQLFDISVETDFIKIAKKVIIQHREHFDGSGFPNQRSGDQIHQVAYIVSLVETFDALLGQKSYYNNRIHSPIEIYNLLKAQSGQRFHPHITKIFLEHFEYFITLRKKIINENINKEAA